MATKSGEMEFKKAISVLFLVVTFVSGFVAARTSVAGPVPAGALATNGLISFVGVDHQGIVPYDKILGIYEMDPTGGNLKEVYQTKDVGWFQIMAAPSWSPDGTEMVFVKQSRHWAPWKLQIMASDGTGIRSILRGPCCHPANSPSWSPDGTELAFVRRGSVWVIGKDGSGLRRVVKFRSKYAYATGLDWAPDGTQLVVGRVGPRAAHYPWQVFAVNADGSGLHVILSCGSVECATSDDPYPQWSPDGSTILLNYERGIATVSPDGTGLSAPGFHAAIPTCVR